MNKQIKNKFNFIKFTIMDIANIRSRDRLGKVDL